MYFVVMTITTVGYGDIVPITDGGKIFIIFYIFFGLSFVAACFGLLTAQVAQWRLMCPKDTTTKRTCQSRMKEFVVPLMLVLVNMVIMAFVLHFNEGSDWVTSFYWAMVSLSSVGYGDPTIEKESTRIFLAIFLLWGVSSIAYALGRIASVVKEYERDNQLRHFVQHGVTKALIREMDLGDGDKQGSVDRRAFLCHMLVKLDRVRQSDIDEITDVFDALDLDGSGTIDEADIKMKKEADRSKTV